MMRCLIRASGATVNLSEPLTAPEIAALIGADIMDSVTLHHLGSAPLYVMCINDRGYECATKRTEINGATQVELRPLRALLPVNHEATRLYHLNCRPGITHQIVGDVVIVPDDDFEQEKP